MSQSVVLDFFATIRRGRLGAASYLEESCRSRRSNLSDFDFAFFIHESTVQIPRSEVRPEEFTLASLQTANAPSKTLVEMTEGEQNRVQQFDFDAFLSHNSEDKPTARELKCVLDARKLTVWFDEDQLPPGKQWQPLLEQGLEKAGSVIVAVGAAGIGQWQNQETQLAIDRAARLQRPVIPALFYQVSGTSRP